MSKKIRMPKGWKEKRASKKVRIGLEVREDFRDEFKAAVTRNGENMTDVLVEYMEYYIAQVKKAYPDFDEWKEELEKERKSIAELRNEIKEIE